jgi:hypothetical protein
VVTSTPATPIEPRIARTIRVLWGRE